MPTLASGFRPPRFLCNGHLQTLLPVLLPRRLNIAFERERLEMKDGDFLDLDWLRTGGPSWSFYRMDWRDAPTITITSGWRGTAANIGDPALGIGVGPGLSELSSPSLCRMVSYNS